ncbi:pilus assembly protein [Burkholderia sp. ABCPW 11]|uniref:fimbria/pilus periplasmic chaperone n=1 Tax=Burkholderia sp. ABCPW 11 TaxID=1637859 RepID=UPI00075F2853|nr:fimbria/pilus periplasmic chaperone [Burkholderia sp. ABCPW 11]KVD47578.1 pilus assembly protein [Burkholderia sp. ABCPW 11]
MPKIDINQPFRFLIFLMSMLLCMSANASVTLSGTRIVFDAGDKEVTIRLTNDGKLPALVQTWLDKGDVKASPDSIDVPFVITPSIFRIEAGKGQTLRIIHTGEPLPADKESLFWLNVLDVPPKASGSDTQNHLQLAFRTRVKLMYRPHDLPGNASDAPAQLKWAIAADAEHRAVLRATNPTAYVVNLSGVALRANNKTFEAGVGYVRPGETATFPINGATGSDITAGTVVYSSMDDWGASHANQATVSR